MKEYYQSLRALQSANYYDIPPGQDISSWVLYWLRCLDRTYEEALERLAGPNTSSDLTGVQVIDERLRKAESLFRRHGKLRAAEYADLMSVGRTQAVADLNALTAAGFVEKAGGGRSTVYRVKGPSLRPRKAR